MANRLVKNIKSLKNKATKLFIPSASPTLIDEKCGASSITDNGAGDFTVHLSDEYLVLNTANAHLRFTGAALPSAALGVVVRDIDLEAREVGLFVHSGFYTGKYLGDAEVNLELTVSSSSVDSE
jgi:hypothetical protein